MNKRTLFFSGGLFTALLASLAIYQTYNDTSNFQASNSESLKVLEAEKATAFQAVEILQASGSTSTAAKVNMTRLTNAYTQVYTDMIPSTSLRLSAFMTTDRLVYRAGDIMLVEVFLFDALRKTPYIPPTTGAPNIDVSFALYDSTNTLRGSTSTLTSNSFGPTIAYGIPLSTFNVSPLGTGTYTLVVTNVDGANGNAFTETSTQFQIRAYGSDADAPSNGDGARIELFGDYKITSAIGQTEVFGKVIQAPGADCSAIVTISATGSYLESSNTAIPPETSATLTKFALDGQLYFSYSFDNSKILIARDQTVILTITNSGSDTDCGHDLKINLEIEKDLPELEFEIADFNIDFVLQDNGDFVSNTTQNIYFHSYYYQSLQYGLAPFDGADLYSYDLDAPWEEPTLLAANVASDANGYGNITIRVPDNSQIYLEIFFPQFEDSVGTNQLESDKPWDYTLDMGQGYLRIPVNPDSVTGFKKDKFLKKLTQASSDLLVTELQMIPLSGTHAALGLNFYYDSGVFSVYEGNRIVAKFNQFPNPANFTDEIIYSYYLEYPNPAILTDAQLSIKSYNIRTVIDKMAEALAADLQSELGGTVLPGLATAITDSGSGDFMPLIEFLGTHYPQTDQLVYAEITVYNQDGPITNYIEGNNGWVYLGDPSYQPSSFEQPSVTFSLNDNVLSSQQDLVVTFQTNQLMDPTAAYLLTVKQKEQVLYSEAFSFSQNINQKRTIPYGRLNRMNGGVFSVDLYKISNLYIFTQGNITSTSGIVMCDLRALTSFTQWNNFATDKSRVEDVLDTIPNSANLDTWTEIRDNAFFSVSNALRPTFKSCIIDSPELLNNFITRVSSSQFYRKPQPAVNVQVSTNKAQYTKGEQVTVTVTLTNMTDNTVGITSGAYLSLLVVEDQPVQGLDELQTTLGEKLYIDHQIDEDDADIADTINKQFDSALSSVSDSSLRQAMAHQMAYNLAFEPSIILDYPQLTSDERDYYGVEYFELCRRYGYKFVKYTGTPFTDDASAISFKQTIMSRYLNAVVPPQVYSNDIGGYKYPFPRNDAQTATDTLGAFYNTVKRANTAYSQALPAAYDRTAASPVYVREVLYFQSGLSLTGSTNTFSFQTGDILTNFKVQAVVTHANGIGFDQTTFSTAAPVQVELDYPDVMVEGEIYTLTATVINMSPQSMNVTFTRTETNHEANSALYVDTTGTFAVTATSRSIAPAGSSIPLTFKFKANKQGATTVSLNFVGSLWVAGADKSYPTIPIVCKVFVAKPYPRRHQYSAGILSTGMASAPYKTTTFDISIPTQTEEEDFESITGDLLVMSSRYAMLDLVTFDALNSPVSEFSSIFANGLEVIAAMELIGLQADYIAYTLGTTTSFDPAIGSQTYFYSDRIDQISTRMLELHNYLETNYAVRNSTGHCMGFDYFETEYERGGSLTLTAYALATISNFAEDYLPDTDNDASTYVLAEPQGACYRQSMDWILSRQTVEWDGDSYEVVGNFTMDPLDIDALGRAPWNITQAYVTMMLLQSDLVVDSTTVSTPNMGAQVEFLYTEAIVNGQLINDFSLDSNVDPYYLALAFRTIQIFVDVLTSPDSASQTGFTTDFPVWYSTPANTMKVFHELGNHQFTPARFPTASNYSVDSFRPFYSYTPFNTYKTDRVIETTAIVVEAVLALYNYDGTLFGAVDDDEMLDSIILEGTKFLRRNNRNGMTGSLMSTVQSIKAYEAFENSDFFFTTVDSNTPIHSFDQEISFLVERDVDGETGKERSYTQDYLMPYEFSYFSGVDSFSGWGTGEYEITITMDTSREDDGGYTPVVGDNTYVTFSFDAAIDDYEFLGELDSSESKIYLQVFSNNDINTKDVGEYVEYQVTLQNYDRGRSHNGIQFIINPSPCLAIDTEYLDEGVAAGDYTSYIVDYSTHTINIYGRGVGPFGYPTFTLAFEKQFGMAGTDTCVERYFSAQLSGFASSLVHAYPADAQGN